MADKEENKRVTVEEGSKTIPAEETHDRAVSESDVAPTRTKTRHTLLITIIALIIVCLLILATALVTEGIANQRNSQQIRGGFGESTRVVRTGHGMFGYGTTVRTEATTNSVTTTVYTYLTGVVVAVNSDNIVIAGNGKQTTITTNSSTKYDNDTKPVVNDTVTVVGTTADNKTTATEIAVTN